MSRYLGWNEAASRKVHNETTQGELQLPCDNPAALPPTLRSFTAINKGPVGFSTRSNAVRMRSRGLDSDMLYDLPDAPLSGSPAPKKRKQTFKTPARAKKTSSSTLSHPWPKATEQELSQLSTPPNSKERPRKRLSSQMELFSSACITKPVLAPLKLITTEDGVKSKGVALGRTTMEKLVPYQIQLPAHCLPDFEASGVAECIEGASTPGQDNDMILAQEKGTSTCQPGTASVMQQDAGDDFPVDDELEMEMVQLPIPENPHETPFPSLLLPVLQDGEMQIGVTGHVHLQPPSLKWHTKVGDSNAAASIRCVSASSIDSILHQGTLRRLSDEAMDSPPIHEDDHRTNAGVDYWPGNFQSPENPTRTMSLAESDKYLPLKPFARPGFPLSVCDRSPITGISSSVILRTCFRIGEALRESALCERAGQDAVIELFARVMDASCNTTTPSKLCFELADLFHGRPPFIRGTLENNKASSLQKTESRMILRDVGHAPMVRCLGRLRRAITGPPGWTMNVINIRPTDWEEVRWTRQIAGAGMAK